MVRRARLPLLEQPDLTLVFVHRRQGRNLNYAFRKKDYATDILSFSPGVSSSGLGELVFCEPVIRRQAKEHGISFNDELVYLLIHGFLHLLGYDHQTTADEIKMMKIQDRLFEKFRKI